MEIKLPTVCASIVMEMKRGAQSSPCSMTMIISDCRANVCRSAQGLAISSQFSTSHQHLSHLPSEAPTYVMWIMQAKYIKYSQGIVHLLKGNYQVRQATCSTGETQLEPLECSQQFSAEPDQVTTSSELVQQCTKVCPSYSSLALST